MESIQGMGGSVEGHWVWCGTFIELEWRSIGFTRQYAAHKCTPRVLVLSKLVCANQVPQCEDFECKSTYLFLAGI